MLSNISNTYNLIIYLKNNYKINKSYNNNKKKSEAKYSRVEKAINRFQQRNLYIQQQKKQQQKEEEISKNLNLQLCFVYNVAIIPLI